MGEEAAAADLAQVDQPGTTMARIVLQLAWVSTLDFATRLPSCYEPRRNCGGKENHMGKLTSSSPVTGSTIAVGPLAVAAANPRYFTIRSGDDRRAVYLTGSHIWNNFHDGMGPGAECAAIPEPFDYNAYLTFL